MHIDVNNAFLSFTAVEMLKNGHYDIRKEVSVIGGDETKRRGIVLAKSMYAKKLGIVTGETLYSARKKYRNLKVYPPNHELYKKMSNALFSYIKRITSDIEQVSIDECFLDYGKVKNLYGDELVFAHKLKNTIYKKFGFTVNIGIANNKLCAKMASDFEKPNKVHTLYNDEISKKMWPLPIGNLYGVGKSSQEKMIKLGINNIYELEYRSNDLVCNNGLIVTSPRKIIFKPCVLNFANNIEIKDLELYYYENNKKRLIVSGGTSILNFTWKDKRNVSELFNYRKINIDNAVPNIYIEITTVDNDKKIIILNSRKI